jgi:hypothetical protein
MHSRTEAQKTQWTSKGLSTEQWLQNAVDKGFLLHGSPTKIDVLRPDKACANPGTIRATNIPSLAMWYAIKPDFPSGRQYWQDYFSIEFAPAGPIVKAAYPIATGLSSGYVYLVQPYCFVKLPFSDDEFLTTSPVVPDVEVPVHPREFRYHIQPLNGDECIEDDLRLRCNGADHPTTRTVLVYTKGSSAAKIAQNVRPGVAWV